MSNRPTRHSLLRRQLGRCYPDGVPTDADWDVFVATVDRSYGEFDDDRRMLERSLDLSSEELVRANGEMRALFQALPDILVRVSGDGTILDGRAGEFCAMNIDSPALRGQNLASAPFPSAGVVLMNALLATATARAAQTVEFQVGTLAVEARLVPATSQEVVVIFRDVSVRRRSEILQSDQQEILEMLAIGRQMEPALERIVRMVVRQGGCAGGAIHLLDVATNRLNLVTAPDLSAEARIGWEQVVARASVGGVFGVAVETRQPAIVFGDDAESGDAELFASLGGMRPEIRACRVVPIMAQDHRVLGTFLTFHHDTATPGEWNHRTVELGVRLAVMAINQHHHEEEIRQMQKMEAVGQLAGGVAHDFNNILTVIRGNLGLLQMGGTVEEDTYSLNEATSAVDRAASLTRQLLTFGRRSPISRRWVDLNEIVVQLSKMLRRMIGENITLELDLTPERCAVLADAGMMEQVLMNFAVNARDAIDGGGHLRIATAVKQSRPTQVGGASPTQVILSVSDNGCGIPKEVIDHIYEPFFTTKPVGQGTGLGLATVFSIVREHGGTLEVNSVEGEGTTFVVKLDRLNESDSAAEAENQRWDVRGGAISGLLASPARVLLVEDESSVRALVFRILKKLGAQVVMAQNGNEATRLWEEGGRRFDLLVTDMIMPGGTTGFDIARSFQAEHPRLKVIICSGYSTQLAEASNLISPTWQVMAKPFDIDELMKTLRIALSAER
ncbi:ATP-binding protein [Synoicihabitans lomoniglobus]|uniref:histidine kinase n=1 Tax=Synoicihabitans lomoniglobus TaxID=2909285 RepID=A0AAF0CPU5_9BACT|nr:ATP-binding protein [Opitutaceae bacterium LMO-M01]WED65841.1 ATP-binding protein [Opitutaceae bacterium LMO-M01]